MKVVIVNGIFKTTYPVLYDPVLLWHQYQVQGCPHPLQAIPMTLADALMRTIGNKLSLNVFISEVGHKVPTLASRGVPFDHSKWYQFNKDLQFTNLSKSNATGTCYDIYPWNASTIHSLQPKFVTDVCDAEPARPVGYHSEELDGDVKVKQYEPIVIFAQW